VYHAWAEAKGPALSLSASRAPLVASCLPVHFEHMTDKDREKLLQYIELCRRIYERMRRENAWPWEIDSPDSSDVVESEDNPNEI
jgi:hypothetical protein